MRLKNLELQGYKTFARQTEFVFDGGITAIVGPNGSGKSNVADAIRWVLGEQSYRALRAKRTEDMIFSGSAQRARLGMASASLVLDNSSGQLPIDFAEVTIARRAYRSGGNEYRLNGSRVRLRDITELLAKSGLARRTYTVIGQGLVDDVLSQRPDDRRALFEEASGISLYQSKRAEALSRLDETLGNLLRVNDIINEIAPRLRRLEREAERAERHQMQSQQLEGLLRIWYGYRWRKEQLTLRRTRDALERRETHLNHHRSDLELLDTAVKEVRGELGNWREKLRSWHRESSELHRQMEDVQRNLAVWQERDRLLAQQAEELRAELADLKTQTEAVTERIAVAEQDLKASQLRLADHKQLVAQAQSELDELESRRSGLSRQLAAAQSQVLELKTQSTDRKNRLQQIDERRQALDRERQEHESELADQQGILKQIRQSIRQANEQREKLEANRTHLEARASECEWELAQSQNRQAELRAQLEDAQRDVDRIQSRYDLLTRLRAEGEGLHAGVRAVLQAWNRGQKASHRTGESKQPALTGIHGTVAQLVQAPPDVEIAIEVALGGHLQDIVVQSFSDSQRAIAYLRKDRRGRATFLPLDTVRPRSRLRISDAPGLVGVGADLVTAETHLSPVVEMLLGRTIVVEDLDAGRRIFEQIKGGFQIVTLGGEVLRSSGSVTGGRGKGQSQGQVLAREREWREMPAQLKRASKRIKQQKSALAEAQRGDRQIQEQLDALSTRRLENQEASSELRSQFRDLENQSGMVSKQLAWRQGRLSQLDQESEKLDKQHARWTAELAPLDSDLKETEQSISRLESMREALQGDDLYQRLSAVRSDESVARGRWEHQRAILDGLMEKHRDLVHQSQTKDRRVSTLSQERSSLAQQIAEQSSREAVIQGWLTALQKKIDPGEETVERLEKKRESLEVEESERRVRLHDAENRHSQAHLTHSRQSDRLERLRRQIMDDFGLVEMEPTEGLPEQRTLPLGDLVSALPTVEQLPENLETEIQEIKVQLRRMGSVNPNAPEDYHETLDRYSFLTAQASDLEEAASSLRQVIEELDDVIRREFLDTFQAVATRFEKKFTMLFGGGTARLHLTDPDNINQTGIEIVARPPGKRQQTLALLSGGERSLTAVALIFSILEVSPPPFCILDEVDAMLDEANVKRFRQALESLAEHTQFILITHNRGTIQAASTIYGISMGEDSISQVVSLRLEGNRIATPDGSTLDLKDG